eukprot:CAMPEP_0198232076 /NCGR_PEP_ID=MMETSP1445-20131203/115536_1 /TAXON_ID=36898 /ORGANISM="Pyramimonas sp., Strain CCMP2087" /LENGTH=252 /DNA_ID=CAMNT_0043912723 /DNA_START=62 /DNA_END=820 /DNA_ORIENTATION=-
MDVASAIPHEDYAKEIFMPNAVKKRYELQPVGIEITKCLEGARTNLALLTGQSSGQTIPQSVGDPLQQLYDDLITVSGEKCDHCGAKRNDPGVTLKFCSKCKIVWYCGTECSRAAWQAGHKRTCRAPGEFRGGDYAQVRGLQRKPDFGVTLKFCSKCKIVWYCGTECSRAAWQAGHKRTCRAPGEFRGGDYAQVRGLQRKPDFVPVLVVQLGDRTDTDRWRVKIIGGEAPDTSPILSVKEENLRNLRQPLPK